ncbi:MAG: TlpA family protein disulfide reductase [Gemmatimonadetes bacterium]|nr:TlpA family protein disulfide reductase [Pseudomonadota bacterium]MCH7776562.1 TlpA family protein disulfide reductase [Gemmatimonadota bacterium]TDI56125.1 MAG: TlpA family protein disulfide reductase [Alphaproteobacteria bacterium]
MAIGIVLALAVVPYQIGLETPGENNLAPTAERASAGGANAAPIPAVQTPPPEPLEFPFDLLDPPRPLPELRFVDGEGRPLTLADFRGKVILLNIWATWCIPCLREMPTLDRLQAKLGGPRFEVVVLSIDIGGIPVVEKFYRALKLDSLGIYVDKTLRVKRDLGIVGIPTTLLIDRQGREIGRLAGPAEWDSKEAIKAIRRYLE